MKWEPALNCQPGEMVRIRLGSVYHYGIFVSEDEVIQFGMPPTAENRAAEGEVRVLATDIDTFACGCIVEAAALDRSEQKRRIPPSETVQKARARVGESGYNLIHNNCEHFVNECVFGESRCTQEEDVRRRWQNRPICDVYLAKIPENVSGDNIFPERRRQEIDALTSPELRNSARFLWNLFGFAAKRSFNVELKDANLRRKLLGGWTSDKLHFSLSVCGDVAAAAVSNAAVTVELDDGSPSGTSRVLRSPRTVIRLSGKNAAAVKYFWVENGAATLMGTSYFE